MDFSLYFNSNAKQNVLPKLLAVAIQFIVLNLPQTTSHFNCQGVLKKFIVFLFHLILPRGVFAPGPNDPPGPGITESSVINTLPPPVAHPRPQTGIKLRAVRRLCYYIAKTSDNKYLRVSFFLPSTWISIGLLEDWAGGFRG